MTNQLGFSKTEANTITGFFLAFNYGLHLLGGYFGGRLMSNRSLFSLGMVLIVVGCLVLSIPSRTMLYLGLSMFLTGSGLNVTCLNCMVTQQFEPDDERRESAFFWLYSAMNIGFFTGFTTSGFFEQLGNYQPLFIIGAVGNFIALALVYKNWKALADHSTVLEAMTKSQQSKRQRFGVLVVLAMIPALLLLLNFASVANRLVIFVGSIIVFVLISLALKQPSAAAKKKMFAFIVLMMASCVFWTLYQIAPMGLTLFIKHNVDATIFGFKVTPQWIQNTNTLVIVFGGPVVSALFQKLRTRGVAVNIPMQFSFALSLIGVAFVMLTIGISNANAQGLTHINWIFASYVLQSLGELLLSPVGYAMIGRLAPQQLQGLMMGSWMMVTGVAATLSNYFSNMMVQGSQTNDALLTNDNYSYVFSLLGWSAIAASIVLVILVPMLRRLIDARDDHMVEIPDPKPA
jgi:proton-dependent oligopeptide transporter, POT family